jgi:hypothetical protein
MSHEEEDTCLSLSLRTPNPYMSHAEEDTCHMRRRIHVWVCHLESLNPTSGTRN